MKQSYHSAKIPTGIVLALAIVSLLGQPAQALYMSNPSGNYLDRTNRHVVFYDNSTGLLTDQGVSPYGNSCYASNTGGPSQCGDCTYVPNDGTTPGDRLGWENPVSQYSFGDCGNAHIDSPVGTHAVVRGDVRVRLQTGEDWWIEYTTQYYKFFVTDPVHTDSAPVPSDDCREDLVTSVCSGALKGWNPTTFTHTGGVVFDYYCVHAAVKNSKLPTSGAVHEAISCLTIPR